MEGEKNRILRGQETWRGAPRFIKEPPDFPRRGFEPRTSSRAQDARLALRCLARQCQPPARRRADGLRGAWSHFFLSRKAVPGRWPPATDPPELPFGGEWNFADPRREEPGLPPRPAGGARSGLEPPSLPPAFPVLPRILPRAAASVCAARPYHPALPGGGEGRAGWSKDRAQAGRRRWWRGEGRRQQGEGRRQQGEGRRPEGEQKQRLPPGAPTQGALGSDSETSPERAPSRPALRPGAPSDSCHRSRLAAPQARSKRTGACISSMGPRSLKSPKVKTTVCCLQCKKTPKNQKNNNNHNKTNNNKPDPSGMN
ncbi:uncharacterized protein ACOB8E_003633 [Sarcophilus harrisii]